MTPTLFVFAYVLFMAGVVGFFWALFRLAPQDPCERALAEDREVAYWDAVYEMAAYNPEEELA